MSIIKGLKYGEKDRNILDIYLPDKETATVFVYLHGGGIAGGSYDEEIAIKLGNTLAKKGIAVVSAEYSIYPDAKFPEFIEDGALAVNWTIENINKYITADKIFIGGSSAGAYIMQMLCFDEKYLARYGIDDEISGFFFDAGQPTTHFNVLHERGIDSGRVIIDDAAPMYYIDGKAQYPPMQFIVSDNDMPNRLEQTMLMMSVLRNFGYDMDKIGLKVMENTRHCSYNHDVDENGESVLGNLVYDFIQKNC